MTTSAPVELHAPPPRGTPLGRSLPRGRVTASWLAVAAACLVTACQRRAPGPDECHDLAVRWILAERRGGYRLGSHTIVLPESAVLERTTACLTTPYDRQLLQCVTSGGQPRACLRAFAARRGPAAVPLEP